MINFHIYFFFLSLSFFSVSLNASVMVHSFSLHLIHFPLKERKEKKKSMALQNVPSIHFPFIFNWWTIFPPSSSLKSEISFNFISYFFSLFHPYWMKKKIERFSIDDEKTLLSIFCTIKKCCSLRKETDGRNNIWCQMLLPIHVSLDKLSEMDPSICAHVNIHSPCWPEKKFRISCLDEIILYVVCILPSSFFCISQFSRTYYIYLLIKVNNRDISWAFFQERNFSFNLILECNLLKKTKINY